MKFQSFKNWLSEQFSNALFEIGEANAKPYPIKTDYSEHRFTTEDNDEYFIEYELVERPESSLMAYVSFFSSTGEYFSEEDYVKIMNKGRMFRIMATVVESIKRYIIDYEKRAKEGYMLYNLEYIGIIPGKNSDDDNRRLRIYQAYINKLLPGVKIIKGKETISYKKYDTLIIRVKDIKRIIKENLNEEFFPDLTLYQEHEWNPPKKNSFRIGWLDVGEDFPTGKVSEEFINKLKRAKKVNYTKGWHDCPFCGKTKGTYELRVVDGKKTYYAPQLIIHYIVTHNYLPPQEFIDAVLKLK